MHYISGTKKIIIDLYIIARAAIVAFSIFRFRFLKELNQYRKDDRSLFNEIPNRYIRHEGKVYAVPDLPPVNTRLFYELLCKEMESINHDTQAPMIFANISISSQCPYKCSYCYNIDEHSNHQVLSIESLKEAIKALEDCGVTNFYLSGGEPLLRIEAIPELVNSARKTSRFWVITTGFGMTKERAALLKKTGLIGVMISLDSNLAEEVDAVKGQGAFNRTMNAMEIAEKEGLLVVVNTVLNKKMLSMSAFQEFVSFCSTKNVAFINCYSPREIHNKPEEGLEPYSVDEYKKLYELTRYNQLYVKNQPIAYFADSVEAKRGCVGGKLFLYISPRGNVLGCPFQRNPHGNILEEPVFEILKRMKLAPESACDMNKKISDELS